MSLADRTRPTPEEYKELRQTLSNWGRWGDEDQLGTLNFITEETRQAAASLVREGRTISLSRPFATAAVDPSLLNSTPAEHRMTLHGRVACTDYIGVSYHGYVNTHIDALCLPGVRVWRMSRRDASLTSRYTEHRKHLRRARQRVEPVAVGERGM